MMLRPLLVLVLAVAPAAGDPPAKPAPAKPAPPVVDVPEATSGDAWATLPNVKPAHPGLGGGTSTGFVIDPGPHPDMQPYPRGMVIKPPDIDGRMLLDLDDRTTGVGKLFNDVKVSVGTILHLLVPPLF